MSRKIPIVVDPDYEANFRHRRRGSEPTNSAPHMEGIPEDEQLEDASKRFFNRKFQRRHSEDPTTTSWNSTYYQPSPSHGDKDRLKRRGSAPVSWDRPPHGRRDRFDEIVERMMSANDEDLLSGIMDFGPFDVDIREEHFGPGGASTRHERVNRSPSAPEAHTRAMHGSDPAHARIARESVPARVVHSSENVRPFGMNYKKDKNGCFEIPIQICQSNETNTKEEKQHKSSEKPLRNSEAENAKKGFTNEPELVEEGVQTDEGLEVKIMVDSTKANTESGKTEENNNNNDKGTSKEATEKSEETTQSTEKEQSDANQMNDALQGDEAKLSHIKKIENELNETHDQVAAFKANNSKDSNKEYMQLEELLMKSLMSLDAVEANGNTLVREARKSVVMRVQEDLKQLEKKRLPLEQK